MHWDNTRTMTGTLSREAMMKQKDQEREEIAQLTAQYLLNNKITVIPYGVRMDIPKVDFKMKH